MKKISGAFLKRQFLTQISENIIFYRLSYCKILSPIMAQPVQCMAFHNPKFTLQYSVTRKFTAIRLKRSFVRAIGRSVQCCALDVYFRFFLPGWPEGIS